MNNANPREIATYNSVLEHPAVQATVRMAAANGAHFNAGAFARELMGKERFPELSVGELIAVAGRAGLELSGAYVPTSELDDLPTPFLCYLKRGPTTADGLDLFYVQGLTSRNVILSNDRFGTDQMPRSAFEARWSGLSLTETPASEPRVGISELNRYRSEVRVIPDLLNGQECAELIHYCEEACFRRSRVLQRRPGGPRDAVEVKVRSSSSVVLDDRRHPVLSRLYERCAALEKVGVHEIESIQCVRYKRGQRFRAHFDGGVNLPRLATYLLYLNDDFDGGETYFPMLDLVIAPRTGSCLRFANCDRDGRVLWASQHGGLPVKEGVKYALNIWVRCPASGTSHRLPHVTGATGGEGTAVA